MFNLTRKDPFANEFTSMARKLDYYTSVLEEAGDLGRPVGDLIPRTRALAEEAERLGAWASGKKIYRVSLRYDRIVADDEKEARLKAYVSHGDLVEARVELVENPSEALHATREPRDREPAEA